MSTTTPVATEYLPGDRVVTIDSKLGTVKETPPERVAWNSVDKYVYFTLDDMPDYPWANNSRDNIRRQPIEVGCYVRVLDLPNKVNPDRIGSVFKVEEIVNGRAVEHKANGGTGTWHFHCLARVVDPAPFLDVASGPDRTVHHLYDPLMQAQALAVALYDKHFSASDGSVSNWKVADDLTGVLNQIDNMTADMVRVPTVKVGEFLARGRINRLADFIASEVPGEPSQSEGAVDTAIRVMRRQEAALASVCKLLRVDGPRSMAALDAWLAEYDPQPPATFKRGDLVTWGAGQLHGRIVKMPVQTNDPHEVIITVVQNGETQQLGKFLNISNGQNMRHSPLK